MALVLLEGFDHFDAGVANEKFWNGAIFGNQVGRDGVGQSISVIGNNPISKVLPSPYSTVIVGAAIKANGGGGACFYLTGTDGLVATVRVSDTWRIYLTDSNGALVGSVGTTPIAPGTWFYVELKVTTGASGPAELRMNGDPTAEVSGTGDFSSGSVQTVVLDAEVMAGRLYDDLYVCDTSGARNNDFLGDVMVETLYPVEDGFHTDWTPDTGTDHWARVDEPEIDGDASIVSSETADDMDTYGFEDLGIASGTVIGLQLNLGVRKTDAGFRQIAPVVRQGSTDYVGTARTITAGYVFYSRIYDADPTGSEWDIAQVNADEYGIKTVT